MCTPIVLPPAAASGGGWTAEASLSEGATPEALVLEAVGDVDPSLLDLAQASTLRERLRACHRAAVALGRFRHDALSPG